MAIKRRVDLIPGDVVVAIPNVGIGKPMVVTRHIGRDFVGLRAEFECAGGRVIPYEKMTNATYLEVR